MFSNLKRAGAIALTVVAGATAFSGCGLKIGERPNQDVTVQLGSAETACLSGAAHTLADYFHGKSSDKQISDVFNCASNSLKLFQDRTRGSRPGIYSPGELRKFLERYFLRDFTISDPLLSEFMELKKTLLGGTTDELTLDELDRLRSLLDTLRDVVVRLRPYLPLTPDHVSQLKPEDLESTIKALREAADSLAKILEERASPYQFSHLDRFLSEIEKFVQDDDYAHDTAEFRRYLPLFIAVKKIVVSPDPLEMANKDWRILISRVADLYGIVLRSYHLLNTEPTLISGEGRVNVMSVSEKMYTLLREIINSNPGNTISFCNLYAAIDEASKLYGYQHDLETLKRTNYQDLPSHLRIYLQNKTTQDDEDYLWYFKVGSARVYRGTIKKLLLPVIQKLFHPVPHSDPSLDHLLNDYLLACKTADGFDNNTLGLKPENLDRLWSIVNKASESQLFLEKTYKYARENFGGVGDPLSTDTLPASLMAWLNADTFVHSLELLYQVPSGSLGSETIGSAKVMSQLIENHIPLFKANDPQITFDDTAPVAPGEIGRWRQSFVGLSGLGAIWQLVHATWDAYVTDPDRIEGVNKDGLTGGISVDELRQFYMDVREIGIAFKLFDPNSTSSSDNRFFEGNLFTYSANGDANLSVSEGTDLVAFLFSSKELSSRMYSLVRDQCAKWTVGCPNGSNCHIGPKDVFGMDTISTECYNHFSMGELYQPLWDHMPNLSRFYSTLPALGNAAPAKDVTYRETFTCVLETVARAKGTSPKFIASGDVDQIAALEHYLEAVFSRFDANHNGSLNHDEALQAYPVLKNVISNEVKKRVSFLDSDESYEAVLTYILAHGTIPSTSDWSSILDFGIWRFIYESKFEADRARVVQVMALITGANVDGCYTNPNILPEKPLPPQKAPVASEKY